MEPPGVLMVTGAYAPEMSGGGLQCRELVRRLRGRARVSVLTTSTDPTLPDVADVDGVPIHRVFVDVRSASSMARAAVKMTGRFARLARDVTIVHFHGFTRKSVVLMALAKIFRKAVVVKPTLVGEDDPVSVRRKGRLDFWWFAKADCVVGVSPRMKELHDASGMPRGKFRLIPNGVDTNRFHPASPEERLALRSELGLPQDGPLILFVGIFAKRKRPALLLEAWKRLRARGMGEVGLAFVGGEGAHCHAVDRHLVERMYAEVRRLGDDDRRRLVFVEVNDEVEKYYRAADVFVLPSTGEGLPNALLEGMASGLPCIATRLPGITDALIEDRVNGLLMQTGDVEELTALLHHVLTDLPGARALGQQARGTVSKHYSIDETANQYLELYRRLTGQPVEKAVVQEASELVGQVH